MPIPNEAYLRQLCSKTYDSTVIRFWYVLFAPYICCTVPFISRVLHIVKMRVLPIKNGQWKGGVTVFEIMIVFLPYIYTGRYI